MRCEVSRDSRGLENVNNLSRPRAAYIIVREGGGGVQAGLGYCAVCVCVAPARSYISVDDTFMARAFAS